jgi:TRAP transporter TAXI family solute receptor
MRFSYVRRLLAVAGFTLVAFAPAHAQQQMISIGTGGTGGVYYPLGGGMANILTKKLPGTQATAEVTGASVDNLKFIRAGKMDVGFTMADAAWDAYQGVDKFKDGKVNARTLMALYPNEIQVVTVEGTGIVKFADLKGKRISTGSPGSGTEIVAFRLLEAAGIDKDKDVRRERLSVAESVNAIKDKKIDAMIWVGGIPTAAITDLAATPGTRIKLIDHSELLEPMNKKYGPLYTKGAIPANSYAGQDKPNANIAVWNLLVVDAKMSDDMAYRLTKTLMESQPDLVAVHKEATNISAKNQGATSPIPYHPGAKKYFEEKGVRVQ